MNKLVRGTIIVIIRESRRTDSNINFQNKHTEFFQHFFFLSRHDFFKFDNIKTKQKAKGKRVKSEQLDETEWLHLYVNACYTIPRKGGRRCSFRYFINQNELCFKSRDKYMNKIKRNGMKNMYGSITYM